MSARGRAPSAERRLERSPRLALGLCLAMLAAVGWLDYAHTPDLAVELLYGAPIALAALYVGRRAAVAIALLAVLTWAAADLVLVGGRDYPSRLSVFWNLGERLGGFVAAALVLSRLEDDVVAEHRKALVEHRVSLAKSEMLSLVSHQFSNALTVMGLTIGILEHPLEGSGESDRQELYRTLKQNVRALSLVAQNFLNQARLQSGHFALERQRVDVEELVRGVRAALEPLTLSKKLTLTCELSSPGLRVFADPDALNVVVTNLLGNAIKYTPATGRIVVGAAPSGAPPGHLRVWVEDTGLGISREDQKRILDGFVRAAPGRKAAAGFGLGLKVSHELLKSHGSRLLIDSEPGKGSRFSFVLPVSSAAS